MTFSDFVWLALWANGILIFLVLVLAELKDIRTQLAIQNSLLVERECEK